MSGIGAGRVRSRDSDGGLLPLRLCASLTAGLLAAALAGPARAQPILVRPDEAPPTPVERPRTGEVVGDMLERFLRGLARQPGREAARAQPAQWEQWDWSTQGAWLRTDADAHTLLERAQVFAREGRYPEAAILVQQALDTAGSAMVSRDNRHFYPLRREAEAVLAALPAEGLAAYRRRVDGEARALYEAGRTRHDEALLKQVTERFFMSSWGDDAAYALACLYMDQYAFHRASGLLERIVSGYPDPSVPRAALLARLAVASSRLGEHRSAEAALRALESPVVPGETRHAPPDAGVLAAVRAEVAKAAVRRAEGRSDWSMAGPPALDRADGRSPSLDRLAALGAETMLLSAWQGAHRFPVPESPAGRYMGNVSLNRRHLFKAWQRWGWLPTSRLVFADGRLYFRTHVSLVCLDAATGAVLWQAVQGGHATPDVQDYVAGAARGAQSRSGSSGRAYDGGGAMPRWADEVAYFGDRISRMITVHDGVVYCIENNLDAVWVQMFGGGRGGAGERDKGSALAAYEAVSGRLRWRIGRDGAEASLLQVRFLAAPVAWDGRLITALEDNRGQLHALALDPQDGRVLWQTFLCGAAQLRPIPRRRPAGISADGGEVFVASGEGVVFALDAATGLMLWATRYRQVVGGSPTDVDPYQENFRCWDENVAIPSGQHLVVLPSDSDIIAWFDRRTGMPIREQARGNGRYYIGLGGPGGGALLLGGERRVLCLDPETGATLWERSVGGATGRAVLAGEVVWIPRRDAVAGVAADDGRPVAELRAETGGDPLGNLFSDGQHLLVAGLERVYALQDPDDLLSTLGRRIESGEAIALLDRARVYRALGRVGHALDDLRRAVEVLKGEERTEARRQLLAEVLAAAQRGEAEADVPALVEEARALAGDSPEKALVLLVAAALDVKNERPAEAARRYLSVAGGDVPFMVQVQEEGGNRLNVDAAEMAGRALQDLARTHGDVVAPLLATESEAALRRLLHASAGTPATAPDEAVASLVRFWRTYPGTEAARRAAREAARIAAEKDTFERAELLLEEMARSSNPPSAAEGLALLADLYERRGWLEAARRQWERLAGTLATTPLDWEGRSIAAGALAASRLGSLARGTTTGAAVPLPPYKLLWSQRNEGLIVFPREDESDFLRDHVILYRNGRVTCLRAATGEQVWQQPEPPRSLRQTPRHTVQQFGGFRTFRGYDDMSGHVLVTASGEGATASGLVSGTVLWRSGTEDARPSPYQWQVHNRAMMGRIFPVSVRGGIAAVCVSDAEVRVFDAGTGRLLWERLFEQEEVLGLRAGERWLAVVLGGAGEGVSLNLFHPASGERLANFPLFNDANRTLSQPLLWAEDSVVFSDGQRLTARALPSGDLLWRQTFRDQIQQIHPFGPDTVAAVVFEQGRWSASLIERMTGKTVWTIRTGAGGESNLESILADADGQHVYTLWNRRLQNLWMPTVVVHDAATGDRRLEIGFPGRLDDSGRRALSQEKIVAHEGLFIFFAQGASVPAGDFLFGFRQDPTPREVVVRVGNQDRTVRRSVWEPVLLRKSDGSLQSDLKMPLPAELGAVQYPQFAVIKGDVILVFDNQEIMAIAHDAAAQTGK